MKLLYAEDERSLSEAVCDILTYHNYIVDAVYDGEEALDYARISEYDGIILDIMMPKLSGVEVILRLRRLGINTPILLLTAKAEATDQILGLDSGADDYLTKPFSMEVLLAHIRALVRRRNEYVPNLIEYGNIALNQNTNELSSEDSSFILPKLEFRLMELLMMNRGIYLSSDTIFSKVWGYDSDAEIGVVWVYISYLRKKLLALKANVKISAKRNIGYMLEVCDDKNLKN